MFLVTDSDTSLEFLKRKQLHVFLVSYDFKFKVEVIKHPSRSLACFQDLLPLLLALQFLVE